MTETSKAPMTREEWLQAATEKFRATFKRAGHDIPPIQVSCGWPSSHAISRSAGQPKAIGECWDKSCSADGKAQIFISPSLEHALHYQPEGKDGMGVLPTLVHEVVHAILGYKEGHNKVFGKLARAVGLEGKLTATHAGEVLLNECSEVATMLGAYPNAKLDPLEVAKQKKKQTTRYIKCECKACGYIARTSMKWLRDLGAPWCPKHGVMQYKEPEGADEDDGNEGEE